MASMEEKIRTLGQLKESKQLQEYVNSLDTDALTELVLKKIHNPSFISFFNYLLMVFNDSEEAHNKRFQLVTSVVRQSQVQTLSSSQLKNIVVRLCSELHKFKTEHLVEMCGICVQYIQKGNPTEQSWNDLLPVLLYIIMEREHVEYNGNDCTGFEYKTQLIQSLLMMEWSPNIVTCLTNMFISMPLTKEEHAQIVNKLGQYMEKLIPQEIPAFVYQLLKLCKNQNSRSVFLRLQNYFGLRVYSNNAMINNQNSESLDMISSASDMDAIQAESTVLFHICESAMNSNENINDYLNSLKNLTKSPEFILHPFQLTALLTISTVSFCETKVFDVLKASIVRFYAEEHKKKDACWFREMVPSNEKVTKVFLQIIDLSIQERNLVLQGLINFSFVLLGSTPAFGKEPIFEKIWALGYLIILQIIKHKRSVASIIIQRLVNCIITEQNLHQYIECLNMLSKKYGLVLLENQSCIIELMERLIRVPRQSSDEILDAIIPLTKISFTLRDHLILLLRKGLFSRSVNTRQMAVGGFLKLITILKFSNLGALSQSSNSSNSAISVLTQISMSNTGGNSAKSTFTNEALCLEVLSILRRCFMQQAEVKYKLYEGLYDAVCTNPDLGIPILELMWSHFSQYYEFEEDVTVPIKFSKLFQVKDLEVVLMEPLGKLLYSVGLILTKYLEIDDTDPTVVRFVNAYTKLSEKMAQCDLEHLQLNDGTDLLDVLPESQEKLLLLKEAISVYEALIGFNMCSWEENSEDKANTVLELYRGYNRLIQFGKNLGKSKKEDKSKNVTRSSQTQNDTTRRDGGGKKVFKPSVTVLNFQCLEKILSLLYKTSVPWASAEEANVLRRNVEFNHFTLQTTISLLQQIKQHKHLTEAKKAVFYKHCKSIATLLFERCISRFKDFSNFDNTAAVLSVDAFYALLQIVNNKYKDKWSSFLSYTTSESSDEINVQGCLDVYKSLLDNLDEDTPQDAETVRYFQTVICSLAILAEQIPLHSNPPLLDWLKQFIMTKTVKSKQICTHLVDFTFDMNARFKTTTSLLKNVAVKLNDVLGSVSDEKVENFEDVTIITETNAGNMLVCLCNAIKSMVDDIDWIVQRLRSEFLMITYPGEECIERRRECLKSKERSICCQICQVISIMTIIADIAVTPGTNSEIVIKNNMNMYTTLTNLTKYFITRSNKVNVAFQQARFESVVKQTGKKLSPTLYRFILFIEQNQQGDGHTQHETKKKADSNKLKSKLLKETRLIPKLVYEMEQFSKMVIQLSKKTKVDITRYVGQGTSRDFRIMNLKETLQEADNADLDSTADDSVLEEREEAERGPGDDSSDTECDEPVPKKSKQ